MIIIKIDERINNYDLQTQELNDEKIGLKKQIIDLEGQVESYKTPIHVQEENNYIFIEDHEIEDEMTEDREAAERFYTKITGNLADFDSKFKLELSMNTPNGIKIVYTCALVKLKLPNIKRISIDNLKDNDNRFRMFLETCIPDKLPLLCLIFGSYFGDEPLTLSKNYREGLQNTLSRVSKEIYLRHMYLEVEDIETIIKYSNAERLLIHYCKIITNEHLDFTCETEYKISYISFYFCGYDADVSMEWDKYPDRFEHIIRAIAN
jgi:hypothetical protein